MNQIKPQTGAAARLNAGTRSYFFDLKRSGQGAYITITESKPVNGVYERQRILIDRQHFSDFLATLDRFAASVFPNGAAVGERSYEGWTRAEDDLLRPGFRAKRGIAEMARIHERGPGAIRSRLKHLGLEK